MKTRFVLKVKFDSYTGNFHRQFNTYVFGRDSYGFYRSLVPKENVEVFNEIADKFDYVYDEYGENFSQIANYEDTLEPLEIHIFFTENPEKYLNFITNRLESFPDALQENEKKRLRKKVEKVKIITVELYQEEINETKIKTIK